MIPKPLEPEPVAQHCFLVLEWVNWCSSAAVVSNAEVIWSDWPLRYLSSCIQPDVVSALKTLLSTNNQEICTISNAQRRYLPAGDPQVA